MLRIARIVGGQWSVVSVHTTQESIDLGHIEGEETTRHKAMGVLFGVSFEGNLICADMPVNAFQTCSFTSYIAPGEAPRKALRSKSALLKYLYTLYAEHFGIVQKFLDRDGTVALWHNPDWSVSNNWEIYWSVRKDAPSATPYVVSPLATPSHMSMSPLTFDDHTHPHGKGAPQQVDLFIGDRTTRLVEKISDRLLRLVELLGRAGCPIVCARMQLDGVNLRGYTASDMRRFRLHQNGCEYHIVLRRKEETLQRVKKGKNMKVIHCEAETDEDYELFCEILPMLKELGSKRFRPQFKITHRLL